MRRSLLGSILFCFLGSCSLLGAGPDVIISEFLAINTRGLTDEDGDDSDWIELSNISGAPVDLAGWHLTDEVRTQLLAPIQPLQADLKALRRARAGG